MCLLFRIAEWYLETSSFTFLTARLLAPHSSCSPHKKGIGMGKFHLPVISLAGKLNELPAAQNHNGWKLHMRVAYFSFPILISR